MMRGGGGGHGGWRSVINSPDEKPVLTSKLLKRVFAFALPYRWQIAAMLAVILCSTGLNLLNPLIMRDLLDRAVPQEDYRRLVLLSIGLLVIPILGSGLNILSRRLNTYVGEGVIFDLRVALYTRLQNMSLRFFTNTRVGELMSRLNNDVIGAQNAISNTIVSMITYFLQALAMLIVMFSMEWRLTLISVSIMPLFILAARSLANRLRDLARTQMEANAGMNAVMNETLNIGGILLIKLFGKKKEEIKLFESRAADVRNRGVDRAVWGSLLFAVIGLVTAVGTALVYGIGGYQVIQKTFTVGTIVAFGAYLTSLYHALSQLTNAPVDFATSLVSFERVFEVLDLKSELEDGPKELNLADVQGELEFDHVSFSYQALTGNLLHQVKRVGDMDGVETVFRKEPPELSEKTQEPEEESTLSQAREDALEDIHFSVKPGQLVALVGPSGAGKTTLTYLIPRLYDPTSGSIRIDGCDLRDLQLDSLSKLIGMVTQETYLFHDTIWTNLVYARPDAPRDEVEAAAKVANIHDFICALPEGYDTVVGERGYRLSGGEKQRLALARVILKDPRILVLDEATSSLDSESEALIQEALKKIMVGRTSIVIAHRLSTILAADQILVMNRGRIVESGKHSDLLTLDGLYAQLYKTQFKQQSSR